MAIVLIILAALVALAFLPQMWVKSVIKRHSAERSDFPGTGGELARHLLDRYDLQEIKVEATDSGDHYDPMDRAVRLTRDKFEGKSLTAITVAHMEVPCCTGIVRQVLEARRLAGSGVPVEQVTVSIQGQIITRRELPAEPVVPVNNEMAARQVTGVE